MAMMWIGQTIKDLREELGWTQNHLGGVSGVHPLTILRIEQAQRYGSVAKIEALLNAMGHEIEIVRIDGDGEAKHRPEQPAAKDCDG
jgi:transcriptional regulator with XRE-family HTH domain